MEEERQKEQEPALGLPPGPEPSETDRLRAELEEAQRQWAYFRNLLQRVQADFSNYRKHVEAEREEFRRSAAAEVLARLLPLLDDLDRAVEHIPPGTDRGWAEGLRLVHRNFHAVLEGLGLQPIQALGRPLDPFEHEVISYEERDDLPEGQVLSVARKGYRFQGRVLRPALVVVARHPRPARGDDEGQTGESRQEREG